MSVARLTIAAGRVHADERRKRIGWWEGGSALQPRGRSIVLLALTHDCWLFEGESIDAVGLLHADDVQYLWLPLAHAFGKVLEVAQVRIGFTSAIDGRIDKLVDNLAAVRPTLVASVPRIFEKVHNRVVAQAKEGAGLKACIFNWAIAVGKEVSAIKQKGPPIARGLKIRVWRCGPTGQK
jgi:long-chain acyl-CoA synthetase